MSRPITPSCLRSTSGWWSSRPASSLMAVTSRAPVANDLVRKKAHAPSPTTRQSSTPTDSWNCRGVIWSFMPSAWWCPYYSFPFFPAPLPWMGAPMMSRPRGLARGDAYIAVLRPPRFGRHKGSSGNSLHHAMVEIVKVTTKGQLTLPLPIREILGISSDPYLVAEAAGDFVLLPRVETRVL